MFYKEFKLPTQTHYTYTVRVVTNQNFCSTIIQILIQWSLLNAKVLIFLYQRSDKQVNSYPKFDVRIGSPFFIYSIIQTILQSDFEPACFQSIKQMKRNSFWKKAKHSFSHDKNGGVWVMEERTKNVSLYRKRCQAVNGEMQQLSGHFLEIDGMWIICRQMADSQKSWLTAHHDSAVMSVWSSGHQNIRTENWYFLHA